MDDKTAVSKAASLMGKRGYKARVERFGIELPERSPAKMANSADVQKEQGRNGWQNRRRQRKAASDGGLQAIEGIEELVVQVHVQR